MTQAWESWPQSSKVRIALHLHGHQSERVGPESRKVGPTPPCSHTKNMSPKAWAQETWLWPLPKGRGSDESLDWSIQLPPRSTSRVLDWPSLTSTPSMACWNRWRNPFCGTRVSGFPCLGATAGYQRGVSMRVQYVPEAGGLEPEQQLIAINIFK